VSSYQAIDQCRIGGGPDLVSVLNLGMQSLTNVNKDKVDFVGCSWNEMNFNIKKAAGLTCPGSLDQS
jgi:hypothetical protein